MNEEKAEEFLSVQELRKTRSIILERLEELDHSANNCKRMLVAIEGESAILRCALGDGIDAALGLTATMPETEERYTARRY